jgi:hypothetical protein
MVQRSLSDERYVMGSRRVDALSGSMVVSIGGSAKGYEDLFPGDGHAVDGGDIYLLERVHEVLAKDVLDQMCAAVSS